MSGGAATQADTVPDVSGRQPHFSAAASETAHISIHLPSCSEKTPDLPLERDRKTLSCQGEGRGEGVVPAGVAYRCFFWNSQVCLTFPVLVWNQGTLKACVVQHKVKRKASVRHEPGSQCGPHNQKTEYTREQSGLPVAAVSLRSMLPLRCTPTIKNRQVPGFFATSRAV
jgi:hypothetical protein